MHRKSAPNLLPWLLGLALVVTLLPAAVAEEDKKDEKKAEEKAAEPAKSEAQSPAAPEEAKKEAAEVEVFTNEDLERLFGGAGEEQTDTARAGGAPSDGTARPGPGEPTPGGGTAQPADPLQWMKQQSELRAERQQQITEAELAVATAQQRVAELEKRLLATKNPFLARPEIPDDEKSAWDGSSGPERVAMTEQQLNEAREELRKAQDELARLRSQP